MVLAKQELAALDSRGIFPHHAPELAGSEEAISAAELELGVIFDAEHRGFLSYADGWRCFDICVMLLGTSELVEGPLREAAFEAFAVAPEPLEKLGLSAATVLPIAASLEQADVYLMPIIDGQASPAVHWIAEGEVIDSFSTFGQFFASMIAYTRRRTAQLQQGTI